ncbi:hypothetical protein BD311DRAFT_807558 [Dichomitus squalens]|uniref:Uncharacterized protein n=1 Tax=Dichomitus squalens TaxID=114155 RepID=A0A4Q9MN28_9APHY|nr:hypothetical protein BD311DRAFT_807558 [Dichomitus squalens]
MRFTAAIINLAIAVGAVNIGAAMAAAAPGQLVARQTLPQCGDPILACTTNADCAACPSVLGFTFQFAPLRLSKAALQVVLRIVVGTPN